MSTSDVGERKGGFDVQTRWGGRDDVGGWGAAGNGRTQRRLRGTRARRVVVGGSGRGDDDRGGDDNVGHSHGGGGGDGENVDAVGCVQYDGAGRRRGGGARDGVEEVLVRTYGPLLTMSCL